MDSSDDELYRENRVSLEGSPLGGSLQELGWAGSHHSSLSINLYITSFPSCPFLYQTFMDYMGKEDLLKVLC